MLNRAIHGPVELGSGPRADNLQIIRISLPPIDEFISLRSTYPQRLGVNLIGAGGPRAAPPKRRAKAR
jgi:hypothetical protein